LPAPSRRQRELLALRYGTDTSSAGHGYTWIYEHFFGALRDGVRSVLEIGVGGTSSISGYETPDGGQSLQMWAEYFPRALVVGVDKHEKSIRAERIRFERGDAADASFLRRVARAHGPFDIVIDDGSHVGRDIVPAFRALWPAVRQHGFYVIEDLALAYHPDWEGGPPGTSGTAVALLKELVDDTVSRAGDPFVPSLAELHVYTEIAVLKRAVAPVMD
jgi:hypothetical protein